MDVEYSSKGPLVNIYIFEHYPEIIVNWLDWEAYIFARVGSSPTLRTKHIQT